MARKFRWTGGGVVGETLYLVAGIIDGHWSGHVAWLDAVNLSTGEWRRLADAPRARDHFQAVFLQGRIYVAGGRRSSGATKQVFNLTVPELDIYDLASGEWSSGDDLPTPRAGAMATAVDDDVLILGGESMAQREGHNEVEAYNITTQRWRRLPPLAQGRHGGGLAQIGDSLFLVAGSITRGGGGETELMEVQRIAASAV